MRWRMALCGALAALLLALGLRAEAKGTETLRFSDDFDDFNLAKWKHELTMGGGGNWEFQMYLNSRQNSYVRDGILYLKPTLTADLIGEDKVLGGHRMDIWGSQPPELCTGNQWWGCERTSVAGSNIINPLVSARLRTAETFTFKYGRVEVRAKLPLGDWLWPAIWMMPLHNSYGQWPASGEIDICESRGNDLPGRQFGVDTYFSTLHWGPSFETNGFKTTSKTLTLPAGQRFSDKFHTFGLYWDEDQLYTYLDDPKNVVFRIQFQGMSFWERGRKLVSTWSNAKNLFNPWKASPSDAAPFDQEFYLIMNLAVGGTMNYFPDGTPGKPWKDQSPSAVRDFYAAKSSWYPTWKGEDATLQIDSVKIWTFPNSVFHYPRGNLTFETQAIRGAAALTANPDASDFESNGNGNGNGDGGDGKAKDKAKDKEAVTDAAPTPAPATRVEAKNVPKKGIAESEPVRESRLNTLRAAVDTIDPPPPEADESLAFVAMSIVALVVAVVAMVASGLVLYWTRKSVADLHTRLTQQQSQSPSFAVGAGTLMRDSGGASSPVSATRIDTT